MTEEPREDGRPSRARASTPADFRADIQALRALAVALVVIYHLWPTSLTGGYVGVDVFFVISGFLITAHMWREAVSTGGIRLARFWARRARRLLPSALTVLAVTAAATAVLVPSSASPGFLKEVLASTFYAENWWLASQSVDYLGAEAAASPVRHFWSLSVEEQFYVLLPVMLVAALWVAARTGLSRTRLVTAVIVIAGAASFAYSLWMTTASPAAYFSTFTRLWEFAFGAVVAIAVTSAKPRAWLAALGLALILWSAWTFDAATPFPGWHAAIPVVGTALVLVGGAGFLHRIGAWRPVAHLGRTSYAVYLWHWPLIVLVPYALGTELTLVAKLAIAGATLALAAFSTFLIEDPMRFSPRLLAGRSPRAVAGWALAGMGIVTVIAGAGLYLAHVDSQQARAEADRVEAMRAEAVREDTLLADCVGAGTMADPEGCGDIAETDVFVPALADLEDDDDNDLACWSGLNSHEYHECTVGPEQGFDKRFLVLGDSHSNALLGMYGVIAERENWRFDVAGHAGCYPTERELGKAGSDIAEACGAWRDAALARIDGAEGYDAILVTRRLGSSAEAEKVDREIDGLVAAWDRAPEGVPVLALADNPRVSKEFVTCLEEHGPELADACAEPRDTALIVDPLRDAALQARDAHVLDLDHLYCDESRCPVVAGGVVMYRPDGHHLSATYARTMAPMMTEEINRALATAS